MVGCSRSRRLAMLPMLVRIYCYSISSLFVNRKTEKAIAFNHMKYIIFIHNLTHRYQATMYVIIYNKYNHMSNSHSMRRIVIQTILRPADDTR